jgi:prolyl 4-hydroxylase
MNRIDNFQELRKNNILVIDNFLTSGECNNMLFQLNSTMWRPSMVVNFNSDKTINQFVSNTRTSESYFDSDFNNRLKKIVTNLELKLDKNFDIDIEKIEGWQISKYGYNAKFDPHVDCLGGNKIYGVRKKTILLYLMAPSIGGATFFRALNLFIKPVEGRLVIWDNLLANGNCDYGMIHGGLPVKKGIKIILNTWVH